MKKLKWNRFYTILVLLMFITVTFASFNTNLFINGKGYVRADGDIRITDIKLIESESDAYETYAPEYTMDTISINSNLPKQNSTLTYQVTIKNSSNYDYDIQNILEQTYSNTNISYEIVGVKTDDTVLEANTTTTFTIKLSNNTTITEEEDKYETLTYTFDYTGGEQVFTVPYDGDYTLEVWGAQGGNASGKYIGGYGAYVKGTISLKRNKKIYINVGGQGETCTNGYKNCEGGYNGGGAAKSYSQLDTTSAAGGGGATSISFVKGELSSSQSYLDSILIVAAGGGGGNYTNGSNCGIGGNAGFSSGYGPTSTCEHNSTETLIRSYRLSLPGTQSTAGCIQTGYMCGGFGYGGNARTFTEYHSGAGSGGGAGIYGGSGANIGAGAGGSSYVIQTAENVTHIDGGNQVPTYDGQSTMIGNSGNGYAKLTITRKIQDNSNFEFDYTGEEQTFTSPYSGIYKLETWGAQGGSYNSSIIGGYGGYSVGTIKLEKSNELFIYVGQAGEKVTSQTSLGGWPNGGEAKVLNASTGNGGGSTHIAKTNKQISDISDLSELLIVAGGGGGFGRQVFTCGGGSGGGFQGNSSYYISGNEHNQSGGGTQISGGTAGYQGVTGKYGKGANTSFKHDGNAYGAGGGGGFYGGGSSWGAGGGGGSGYIGNPLLTNKVMYCYNCEESQEESTKTVTTQAHSDKPKINSAKEGNGYSRITLLQRLSNNIELKLKFDFQKLTNYKITYNLDGGTLSNSKETYTRNDDDFTIPTPTKAGYTFKGWTGGKNIFNSSKGLNKILYGITNTVNSDKSITSKGTITNDQTYIQVVHGPNIDNLLKDGEKYTLSQISSEGIYNDLSYIQLNIYKKSNSSYEYAALMNGIESKTIVIDKEKYSYSINIQIRHDDWGNNYNEVTNYFMLEENDKATSYEPYISTAQTDITILKGSRGNRTYTAVWEPIEYNISYDLDGGTLDSSVSGYSTESEDITLPTPTKEGYEFTGWTGGKNLFNFERWYKERVGWQIGDMKFYMDLTDRSITSDIPTKGDFYSRTMNIKSEPAEATANALKQIGIPVTELKDYVFSYELEKAISNEGYIFLYAGDGTCTYFGSNGKSEEKYRVKKSTMPENTKYLFFRFDNESFYTTPEAMKVYHIQLEEGTEATPYEDYISTPTTEITISKGSLGNRKYIANWEEIPTGVYAKLYDTDSDNTGDTLVLGNKYDFSYSGTIIKDYDNTDNTGTGDERSWIDDRTLIKKVDIINEIKPTSTSYWFSQMTNLEEIKHIENLNTSETTEMTGMFKDTLALTSLDVSHFDTSKVTDMHAMFYVTKGLETKSKLKNIDLTNFDTSNVINMDAMFNGASFKTLDLSSFDTSSVQLFNSMFRFCEDLVTIIVSDKFVIPEVSTSGGMFVDCEKLIGGKGTTYTGYSSYSTPGITSAYAHIDGGTESPGYFTEKGTGEYNFLKGWIVLDDGTIVSNDPEGRYDDSYYTKLIYLEKGKKYTINGFNSADGIRWRLYDLNGNYVNGYHDNYYLEPIYDSYYVRILLLKNVTDEVKQNFSITVTE